MQRRGCLFQPMAYYCRLSTEVLIVAVYAIVLYLTITYLAIALTESH